MNSKKIALVINPWITDFKLYDEWMHPTGLYFLISLLKHNHWTVHYIDCLQQIESKKRKKYGTGNFESKRIDKPLLYESIARYYKLYGIEKQQLLAILKQLKQPDLICIGSSMTYWNIGLTLTIETLHLFYPQTPIIVGGLSALLLQKHSFPDYCTLFDGLLPRDIPQLQSLHPLVSDLSFSDWTPCLIPGFELLHNPNHSPILTSFGCRFHCSYCASNLLYNRFELRSQQVVLEEVKYMQRYKKVNIFAFYDDALLCDAESNLLPILEHMKRIGIQATYHVPNGLHICYITKSIARELFESGFCTIRCGYETSNPRFRSTIDHKVNRELLREKVSILKHAGFTSQNIGIYIMAGLPEQMPNDVLDELAFIYGCAVLPKPVFLSPVPKTQLFIHYASLYPILLNNPLSHNDSFFTTLLPQWGYENMENIKRASRNYAQSI